MAVGDARVFHGFLTPELSQLSFQSHRLLFSHASAKVRGENMPERKFASTGYQTHNHQVVNPGRTWGWKYLQMNNSMLLKGFDLFLELWVENADHPC